MIPKLNTLVYQKDNSTTHDETKLTINKIIDILEILDQRLEKVEKEVEEVPHFNKEIESSLEGYEENVGCLNMDVELLKGEIKELKKQMTLNKNLNN